MWVFIYLFLSLSEEHWRVCSSRHIEPLCFQENGIFLNNVRTHTNLGVSPVRILVYFFLVGWSKVYLCVSLQVFVCFFPTAEGSSYMNIHIWPHCRPGCGGTLQSQGLMSTCSLVSTRSRVTLSLEANCRRSHLIICFKIISQTSSTQITEDPFVPYFFNSLFCIPITFSSSAEFLWHHQFM